MQGIHFNNAAWIRYHDGGDTFNSPPSSTDKATLGARVALSDEAGSDEYGIVAHAFMKSRTEQVRFSLNEFRGVKYIDVRVYYLAPEGTYHPTKKGVTFKPSQLADLMEGVVALGELVGTSDAEMHGTDVDFEKE